MYMKYSYSTFRLYQSLLMGLLWSGLGVFHFMDKNSNVFLPYLFAFVGAFYLFQYYYFYSNKYLEVTDEKIVIYSLPKKEIELSQLSRIAYSAGVYSFQTGENTFRIAEQNIHKDQRADFRRYFESLRAKKKR